MSRRFVSLLFAIVALVVAPTSTAVALPGGPWSPPVDGPVVRGFDPPATRFGPGHLGVDYRVAPGTAVRAAGAGTVVFAGLVGTGLHVVVLHAGAVRTTDSFLATVAVVRGQHVERGAVLGRSGGTGPGHAAGVLHFGVRVGDEYVDPLLLFAPPDLGAVVHLAEPHGGSFAGSAQPFVAPGADAVRGEDARLAAGLRVDARPPVPPPSWWSHAEPTPAPAAHTRAAPAATRSRSTHDPIGPAPATTAATAGASLGAAIVLRRRSRRRA